MSRGSSINFKKSSAGMEHNDRTGKEPKYLLPIEHRKPNEIDRSAVEAKADLEQMIEDAKEKYQERTGQRSQAKVLTVEAVINLEAHHTLEDIQAINKELEERFGFRAVQSSIHRDEGYINEDNKVVYNYHAHVVYCNLDKDGKTILKGLSKEDLRSIQDLVADRLQMTRGQDARETKVKHKSHQVFKAEKLEERLAKQKDLKAEIAELRSQLKEQGADRQQYAELEALNRELQAEIKAKNLTVQKLKQEINSLSFILEASNKAKISPKNDLNASKIDLNQKNVEEYVEEQKIDLEAIFTPNRYKQHNANQLLDIYATNDTAQKDLQKLERESDISFNELIKKS
ncbi:MAG: hypothetical protein IE881_08690, partial [Epsilonproteobacteria bacterium]|nr:hypothetical protein [Campylobacterota bacterium]